MCFFNSGGDEEPPAIQSPAQSVDPQVQAARSNAVRRSRAATGSRSTILTDGNDGTSLKNKRKLAGRGADTSTILTTGEQPDFVLGA